MGTATRLGQEDLFLRYQLRAAQGLEQAEALFIVALMVQQEQPDFGHDIGLIAASILAQSNAMLDEAETLFDRHRPARVAPRAEVAVAPE